MINNNIVKRFIELSLNPVPVKEGTKNPTRKNWTEKLKLSDVGNYNFGEIGISTGYSSLSLEAIDFDLDKTEDPVAFMESYNKMIPKTFMIS